MFKVFVANTPLFSLGEATLLDGANVISFRDEVNALGAATIEIMLRNYSDAKFSETASVSETPFSVGKWIAIMDTEKLQPAGSTETSQILYQQALEKPSATDSSIVWWGYISSFNQEWSKGFKDFRGTINCYQFGHYLRSLVIDRKNSYKEGTSNENGFNPVMDDGSILGNFNAKSDISDFGFINGEPATDPSKESNRYWKVKDIFAYLAYRASIYNIEVNYSGIDMSKHAYLNSIESAPSYHGQNLIDVIDDLLEPLKIAFRINSLSYIEAYLIDTSLPKPGSIITYSISPSTYNFQITSEEQKYDRVVMRGDRILFSASSTTYKNPQKGWGLRRLWNNAETTKYCKPLTYIDQKEDGTGGTKLAVPITEVEEKYATELEANVSDLKDEKAKQREEELIQDKIDMLLKTEDSARKKDNKTYQQFGWDFCNSDGTANITGSHMFTCERPGDYNHGNIFPVFPRVEFQNTYDENQIVVNDTIAKTLKSEPNIINGSEDAAQDSVTTIIHETPPASEFKFEDWIPIKNEVLPEGAFVGARNKNRPIQLYARSVGIPAKYSDEYYLQPVWFDITSPSFNSYSGEVEMDWRGIRVKTPYPEVFGCGYDDIFRDPYSSSSFTSVKDYGFQRNEWEGAVGASIRDPYRTNYIGKAHWGRLVLSFSAYSNQKLEVSYGKTSGKEKIVEDPSYKCYILRKGLVYETKNDFVCKESEETLVFPQVLNSLKYLEKDVIVRNDAPLMVDSLKILYDYYTKEKRAVRIEDRIYDETGASKNINCKVGDYWSKVKDGNATLNVNSYVASIEYLLEKTGSPRVIISTEYPASPIKTRRRQIRWGGNTK